MRGRPALYTTYRDEQAIFNTTAKKVAFLVLVAISFLMVFQFEPENVKLVATAFAYAIGAIGLNLVSGYAGQVSLGHAFFLAVGAYTAIVMSTPGGDGLLGLGLTEIWVWLPAVALTSGVLGYLVAPLATRLRGLYLAIVTLGLVFLGEHIFRSWNELTGGVGIGRPGPEATLFGFDFGRIRGDELGVTLTRDQRYYLLCLVILIVMGFLAKNLARSSVGRSFSAIRDQDIAAEVMGVDLKRTKQIAFAISSVYAGVSGALLAMIAQLVEPSGYNLVLSILFIAMILVGGPATISGSILGAMVIGLLPAMIEPVVRIVQEALGETQLPLNQFEIEQVVYGGLLIVFLIAEPRGLYGLWLRARNYWKAFPFSF